MTKNTETPIKDREISTFRELKTPILFLISCPIIFLITGQIATNNVIDPVTIISLIIMFLVFCSESIFARKKLLWVIADLKNATNSIKAGEPFIYYEKYFNNPVLNEYLVEYIKEKKAAYANGTVRPDISNYINENIIASVIHREITDQISNVMTGLGILGTFIGLTMGLETFNSQDAINSTPELLSGIKVAFYTSIFGVVGSIIYNHYYHKDLEECNLALEQFYSVFYEKVAPSTEKDYYNKMLEFNQRQATSLDALAGSIAGELAPKFAEAINKSVTPTMEKLNKSIDDYIMRAVDAQSETIQKIVDKFMNQLNKSLDNQFLNLSRSIKDMCDWQDDSTEKLKLIMGSLTEMAEGMNKLNIDMDNAEKNRKEINDGTNGLIDRARRYTDAFKDYADNLKAWTDEIKSDVNKTREHEESLAQLLEQRYKENDELRENLMYVSNTFGAYKESLENSLNMQKNENLELHNSIDEIVKKLEEYIAQNTISVSKTTETYENAIKQVVEHNNKLNASIDSVTKQIEKMNKIFNDSANREKENLSKEVAAWKELSKTLDETLKQGMAFVADSNVKLISEKILPILEEIKNNKKRFFLINNHKGNENDA